MSHAEFDSFAKSYEQELAKSLAVTGETRQFYAQRRIDWTAVCLARLKYGVRRILDYGCGDGANVPTLAAKFKADQVVGIDLSRESIAVARQSYASPVCSFFCLDEFAPKGDLDLAFTNGVFHHIVPRERHTCLRTIRQALRPGGIFAFWENNPWNPGTRYVMSQCAFDENAITISPLAARRILSEAGFKILRTDSLFYFPRQLKFLRGAERWLRGLPFGGQYLALCQNPSD